MDIANNFPVFEADQVLSNDHLNSLFNYLDHQNRLTRCKLIGSGIVCGLEIAYSQEGIHISKGSALTSQGFMILLCKNDYTYYMPYDSPDLPPHLEFIQKCPEKETGNIPFYKPGFENDELLQLITTIDFNKLDAAEKQKTTVLSSVATGTLGKYAVVLFLEAEELNLKNCDTNDCNDKGSRMDFDVKVLLVKKTVLDRIKTNSLGDVSTNNNTGAWLQPIELKRYNVPVNNIRSADEVLNAFVSLVDDTLLNRLSLVLNDCYANFHYLLEEGAQNPFIGLDMTLHQLREKIIASNPVLIQYFYDFIDDLIKAYHEFRHKLKDVMSECCGDEMRFPLHIMLGDATVGTGIAQQDAYRQYFIYSPLFDSQKERLAELRLLFTRMRLLLEEFTWTDLVNFGKIPVKITPSRYGSDPLSKRCIPYYYKVAEQGKELYRSWNYNKTRRGKAKFNLSYHAAQYTAEETVVSPLLYDIEPFNFFRVEGHIGKGLNDALIKVKTIQQDYNLPFETIALSADFIGTLVKGQEPHCVIQDLESDYRVLIAEFVCRLHDAFCLASGVKYKTIATFPPAVPFGGLVADRMMSFAAAAGAAAAPTAAATAPAAILTDDEDEDKIVVNAINNNAMAADHIYISTLVNEFHATKQYQKGDTLARLCNPGKGLLGNTYISIIKHNKGIFKNPVAFHGLVPISILYFEMFEFIDRVESMFKILMSNELAELNADEFKIAYKNFEVQARNLRKASLRIMNEVQMILDSCIVERLEALKMEYSRRTDQYRLAKNFSYYFKKHGGIEHKGGVPKGGTFILVYHEKRNKRFIDPRTLFLNKHLSTLLLSHFQTLLKPAVKVDHLEFQSNLLQTATLFKEPELYMRFRDIMHKYLDECHDLPDDRRKDILAIINRPPERKGFELTDGMVIADFYVPYLCCSDCPPVAYILPPPSKDETATPTLIIDPLNICSRSDNSVKLVVNIPGGSFILDGTETMENISRSSDTVFLLARKDTEWAPHEIAYKVGNDISSVQKLTVTKTPDAKIFPDLPGEAKAGDSITFDASTSVGIDEHTSFEWVLTGNSIPVDVTQKKFTYIVQPNDELLKVKVKVSNGTCSNTSKEFEIRIIKQAERRAISVCNDTESKPLEGQVPTGAIIKVLNNGGGLMDNNLVIHPSTKKIAKTTVFNVSYSINGNQIDVAVTILFINADFTITIGQTTATNQQFITLILESIDKTYTTNEWKIKPAPLLNPASTLKDDPLKSIRISTVAFREQGAITIEHILTTKNNDMSCGFKKEYNLLFTNMGKALAKGSFDNNFKF